MSSSWFCHCCSAKNDMSSEKCRVCGRPESYVQIGHHLPLHGDGALVYRPSHIEDILPNIFAADSFEWQSLHVAVYNKNVKLVESLLELGADANALTIHGHSPLILAAIAQSADCTRVLLRSGASPNIASFTEKLVPLHIASASLSPLIVEYLLDGGADISETDIMERTALHHAAIGGSHSIASLLIQRGIKQDAMDIHGWTARQTAEYYGFRRVEEVLVRASLTVKQIVLKDLPKAEWHGSLWSDFIDRKNRMDIAGNTTKKTGK